LTQLTTLYGGCALPAVFVNVRNNLMSYYPNLITQALLTPGQRARIFAGGGPPSFLTSRNQVFAASTPATITSVVQTSSNSIVVNGLGLQGPYSGPNLQIEWRATLGSPICSGSGVSSVFQSDIAPSAVIVNPNGTTMTAVFPGTIPHGRHDVCIVRRYLVAGTPAFEEVVAVSLNALSVAPFVDLDVTNAPAGQAVLTVQTTAPSQPVLFGIGQFTPAPFNGTTTPYPVLLVNPDPNLVLSNLVSDANGQIVTSFSVFGLPVGGPGGGPGFLGVQAIDQGPGASGNAVTNAIALRIP
jgi:hypothetical protein